MTKSRQLCYLRRCRRRRNNIQVMCDHLRSIVRSRMRMLPLSQLWPQVSQVVRDTILGPRVAKEEGGPEGRKGRHFSENGMLVTEVEILEAEIEDSTIAELMRSVQRESVTLTIGDRQAQEKLTSLKLRAELERQQAELQSEAKRREAELLELSRRLAHEAKQRELRDKEILAREQLDAAALRENSELKNRLDREDLARTAQIVALGKESEAKAGANQRLHGEEIEHLTRLRNLEVMVLEAQAKAIVAERTAVQPQLVEALTAIGDKALLTEVAHNMNLISLFRGKEAGQILQEVVGGSRFATALQTVLAGKTLSAGTDVVPPPPAPAPSSRSSKKSE